MNFFGQKRIYLDYASATPILPAVKRAMSPFWNNLFGNPSALHKEGVEAKNAVNRARKNVADIIGAHSDEIVFTGSGTESDNLAFFGIFESAKKNGIIRPHFIVSVVEHPAVLEACREIEKRGGRITYVAVNESGLVKLNEIDEAISAETVLVSVMYANNEIGTIQPIREIAKEIRKYKRNNSSTYPYFHTDASQAPNYLDINVERLGVDFFTMDGGKIYGPKGVGVLFVRRGINIEPQIYGGGQEKGARSGTENTPAIMGFSKALECAHYDRERESARLTLLRDMMLDELQKIVRIKVNGCVENRLPNNISICIEDMLGEFAVLKLDSLGVACSTGSSCKSISDNSVSYVVEALRKEKKCAESSVRFTLGRYTTKKDVKCVCKVLRGMLE